MLRDKGVGRASVGAYKPQAHVRERQGVRAQGFRCSAGPVSDSGRRGLCVPAMGSLRDTLGPPNNGLGDT